MMIHPTYVPQSGPIVASLPVEYQLPDEVVDSTREVTILEFTAPRCAQEMGRHFVDKGEFAATPVGTEVGTKYGAAVVVARGGIRNGLFCCDNHSAQKALAELLEAETGKKWSNGL